MLRLLFPLLATVLHAAPFRVEIVDRENGWPVPLVELRTTSGLRFVSDNNGLIAIDAPELQGREVYFHVRGHGYSVEADGFGYRGIRLTPLPDEKHRVEVGRGILAKRLGRLTGSGRFAESAKLGVPDLPVETGVVGCDTIQLAAHRGRLFHLWGDTTLFHYPLGVFDATAAWTAMRPLDLFEPPVRIDYDLFRDGSGRPRAVAPIEGEGPTWIGGMVSLPDNDGNERLVASYAKIRPPLEEYETGLCVWNDETRVFEGLRKVWTKDQDTKPPIPHGHAVRWVDPDDRAWVLFGDPFPFLRCEATYEAWTDPASWEKVEAPKNPRSLRGDDPVEPHRGSIAWSGSRDRWVAIFTQKFGKPSAFGEIWFAESKSPFGPWENCLKVLGHDNYTFYNPRINHEFTPHDAGFILFEGTYTETFADKPEPTPRHDYNQILYRLDFDDLPEPR